MRFTRTLSGLISKYLFYDVPLIWVEGREDIPFYNNILKNIDCRMESAGGKGECFKLAFEIINNDFPFIVILDGDYDILLTNRNKHRRVVILHRYSFENYLFEKDAIERVCMNYTRTCDGKDISCENFNNIRDLIEREMRELVVLDVAHTLNNTEHKVLPDRIEPLLDCHIKLTLNKDLVENICESKRKKIDVKKIEKAEKLIDTYTLKRRFVDLVKGHLIFSFIRLLLINSITQKAGRRPNIDNIGLLVLLSSEVWNSYCSADHESLSRRLKRAVKEVSIIRAL